MTEETSKILTAEALAETVERLKARRCRVVFANGCFDILHVGHIRYLREAAPWGTFSSSPSTTTPPPAP